jgi:hypothetical protein
MDKPHAGRPRTKDHTQIVRLLKAKQRPIDIARTLGCSRALVYYVAAVNGYAISTARTVKRTN